MMDKKNGRGNVSFIFNAIKFFNFDSHFYLSGMMLIEHEGISELLLFHDNKYCHDAVV